MRAGAELLAAETDPATREWSLLATLLERARQPTLAERAAAHADRKTEVAVARWAAVERKINGLSVDGEEDGVPPEPEDDYLRAAAEARAAMGTNQESEAIATAASQFSRSPLGPMLRCEASLRRRSVPLAQETLRRAARACARRAAAQAGLRVRAALRPHARSRQESLVSPRRPREGKRPRKIGARRPRRYRGR